MIIAGTAIIHGGDSNKLKALPENLASFQMITEWVVLSNIASPIEKVIFCCFSESDAEIYRKIYADKINC